MTGTVTLERPTHTDNSGWLAPPPADTPTPSGPPPDGAAPKPPLGRGRRTLSALVAVIVLAGGTAGGVVGARLAGADPATTSGPSVAPAPQVAAAGSGSLAQVVAAVSPSVVTITVSAGGQSVEGSGVILSAGGLILTNNHVIESGGTIRVHLASGASVAATLVGRDAGADVAVLQAQGVSGLTPAVLGTDTGLRVGDTVLAFGSPLGLDGTVTSGIVSAVDRDVSSGEVSLTGLIQTDAAINAGNSGGALVNVAGQVIGINVAIATAGQDSGSIGVGFAVPIDTVKKVVDTIRANAS